MLHYSVFLNCEKIRMCNVSVILPVYNCEKFLKHTVRSVQNQQYKNWELLIVNDASTDNSLAVAKTLAATDSRIKVFNMKQNQGVAACRNYALKKAAGRYVAFIDSDDLWASQKLNKQLLFMKKHHAALSHTGCLFMDENGDVMAKGQGTVDEKIDLEHYLKTTQIGMSTVMIDRAQIDDIHFPEDRKVCEDARVWVKYLRQGIPFYGLNEYLMMYRVRSNQLSKNKAKMALNTFVRYINEDTLPPYKRLECFGHYAINGFKKRMVKNKLNMAEIYRNFNCHQK